MSMNPKNTTVGIGLNRNILTTLDHPTQDYSYSEDDIRRTGGRIKPAFALGYNDGQRKHFYVFEQFSPVSKFPGNLQRPLFPDNFALISI